MNKKPKLKEKISNIVYTITLAWAISSAFIVSLLTFNIVKANVFVLNFLQYEFFIGWFLIFLLLIVELFPEGEEVDSK